MLSDNPGTAPWHDPNPRNFSLEEEMNRVHRQTVRETEHLSSQTEVQDANLNLTGQTMQSQSGLSFTHGSDATTNEDESLQTEVPDITSHVRSTSIVKSSASFNSPWIIEEKPERAMHDDEIQSSRIFELYKLQAVNFELKDGDTLVFIDYPTPSARSPAHLDCYGTAYRSREFRVHSEKLLATGSTVFKEMLGPTSQFRTQRRRKVVNKLPEGVKFVLDLTPPSEGDDLVFMMTELSLTPGIAKWWMAEELHGVDSYLVNGHDDVCSCMREKQGTSELGRPPPSPTKDTLEEEVQQPSSSQIYPFKGPPKPQILIMIKEGEMKLINETPHYRDVPDYCPVRHCNGIIRLLMLIEGHNIILDSANRVWTLLGVAKILDCPLLLRDKVVQWLMYGVNARFIEVLPEEALRIGFALELPEIAQCAFRILVNELALDLAASPIAKKRKDRGVTVFGRKRGNAGDELNNLVQHAAQAFLDRVESQMKAFEEGFVADNLKIQEWLRLMDLAKALSESQSQAAKHVLDKVRDLMRILYGDFRRAFQRISGGVQAHHSAAYESIDRDRASYVAPEDFQYLTDVFKTLTKTQLRLCPFFYHDLMYVCEGLLSYRVIDSVTKGPGPRAGELVAEIRTDLEALHTQEPDIIPLNIRAVHPVGCQRFTAIHLFTYRHQLENAIKPVAQWWYRHHIDPPSNITRHLLLTLGPNELKYLPLWAGGNDDGTGGVFEPQVPSTDMGPNGPGPAYHTGITVPSVASSVSGSLMDEIRNMDIKGSTTAGSIDVHDSISTVYRSDRIIADDNSIATEPFTVGEGGEYAEARFMEPADHQTAGRVVDKSVVPTADEDSARSVAWEAGDYCDSDSDTLSDSSMVML